MQLIIIQFIIYGSYISYNNFSTYHTKIKLLKIHIN